MPKSTKTPPDIIGVTGPQVFEALGLGTPEYGFETGLTPKERRKRDKRIEDAEREIDEKFGLTTSITIRWSPEALDDVKAAAQRAGVPYQTWVKVVAHREALAQLAAAQAISAPPKPGKS